MKPSYYPHKAEFGDGVFIEPRINAEGKLFLHVLNFWDIESEFRITLKRNAPVWTCDFDGSAVSIDGRTISGRVKNYLIVDCGIWPQ